MRAVIVLALIALAGCDQAAQQQSIAEYRATAVTHGEPDFGASIAAGVLVKANETCDAAGHDNYAACAEAGAGRASRSAKTALRMYEDFKAGCHESAGADRCNSMLLAAFFREREQASSSPPK